MRVVNDYDSLLKDAVQKALDDPKWFYDNILRFQEDGKPCVLPWQVEATEVVLDARRPPEQRKVNKQGLDRLTIRSCHGTGKTQYLGLLAHIHGFTTYDKNAATAPKQAQLTKRLFPNIRRAMRDAVPEWKAIFDVQNQEVKIGNDPDWGLIAETASEPDNLAGLHPMLFMVDEAAAKRLDPMYQVIYGALTRPGAVLVEIGNPTRVEGEFYNHHMKSGVRDMYYRMHVKQKDAPTLITEDWVNKYIQTYGINSPITKIRALGEFAAFDEYLLIQPEQIEDALDIEEDPDGSRPKLRISVDVADGGQDSTVITAARHYQTFIQVISQKQYYFETAKAPILAAKAAASMFEGYNGSITNGDDIVVDSIGVGAGTAGRLIEDKMPVVIFKGGAKSSNPERWRNKRVQGYMVLWKHFCDQFIRISPGAIDDEEELRAHLLSVKRAVSNERVDDIETKDKIKQAGLPSPDRADSLMMQCAGDKVTYKTTTAFSIGEMETARADY